MKRILLTLIILAAVPSSSLAADKYFHGHRFEAYVKTSSSPWSGFTNHWRHGKHGSDVLRVREGQEYSIVVKNPLPVRVAAAVTVDGLNTIDGKRTSASRGQKWIIDPYSSITIRGWQTDNRHSRRFYFTREGLSYANWKEQQDGRSYTQNLGVIGIAYFWDSSELYRAQHPHRPYGHYYRGHESKDEMAPYNRKGKGLRSYNSRQKKAGTGMGHKEWNKVNKVYFHYDTGMYSSGDAVTIRYKFAEYRPHPKPFEDYRPNYRYKKNYAPEMPYRY